MSYYVVVLESRGPLPQHDYSPYKKNSVLRFESCHHKPRNCPKLGEKTGKDPPLELSKGTRPCQRPGVRHWASKKLWGNKFLLFKPLGLWCFVRAMQTNQYGGRTRTDNGKSGSRMKVSCRPRNSLSALEWEVGGSSNGVFRRKAKFMYYLFCFPKWKATQGEDL